VLNINEGEGSYLFHKFFQHLTTYNFINIGQVEFIKAIIQKNNELIQSFNSANLFYFVELIQTHGQYS